MSTSGFSLVNNLSANTAQLNLTRNQAALSTSTARLSSGLRINSAADDPSGLAISESLQAQVNGFDQATQNVQNANNAATVAEGALQTTTDILQRIRSLAVEASSDINSTNDKANLQTEVSQLLLEINRISQNTTFNGLQLLDGSHAGYVAAQTASLTITSNAALASSGPGILTSISGGGAAQSYSNLSQTGVVTSVRNLTGLTAGNTYTITFDASGGGGILNYAAKVDGAVVESFSGAAQPLTPYSYTFTATGADTLSITAANVGTVTLSNIVVTGGAGKLSNVGVNGGLLVAYAQPGPGSSLASQTGFFSTGVVVGGADLIGAAYAQGFTTGTVASGTTVDGTIELQVVNTGLSIAVVESFFNSGIDPTASSTLATVSGSTYTITSPVSVSGSLLAAGSTSTVFDNVQLTLGAFGTNDVGVTSYIKIAQQTAVQSNPTQPAFNFQSGSNEGQTIQIGLQASNTNTLRLSNVNLLASTPQNPSLGAEDAIGQVDRALQQLLGQQAQLGAIVVRLNLDETNDQTAANNLQASESNIRDLNISQESTNFNRLTTLVQVGTSVLAQANIQPSDLTRLFQ